MKTALIFIIFFTFHSTFAKSSIEDIALSKKWLNLLHYKPNIISGFTSEADEPTFFYHQSGATNPLLELQENIKAYKKDKKEFNKSSMRPECRFPARTRFLLSEGLITNQDIGDTCTEFEKFRNKVAAKSISIVFSSYFLDTPASAFGHTFMRLNKNIRNTVQEDQNFELLDYAINYSANVTTNNALIYSIMGFAGGFKGEFAAMPYFYKVREYNDYESRDLWSYDLNLTQKEVDTVVAHIWEMGQTYFNYFYLTENCSYHMLGLLDVANDSWNLSDKNPTFVLPVDTIKTISNTPGLVRRVGYRPSKMQKAKISVSNLKESEVSLFENVINSKSSTSLDKLPNKTKAKILDTAIDYLDYKHSEDILLEKKEAMKWKQELLISRSETGIQNSEIVYKLPEIERPENGHGSRRFTLGAGEDKLQGFYQTLSYRFALHDFYDSDVGQNPQATMEMVNIKLKYFSNDEIKNKEKQVAIDHLSLVRVISISPIKKFFSNLSWRFDARMKSIKDGGCEYCLSPGFEIGGGASLMGKYFKSYLFLASEVDVHKELSKEGFRIGVGPELEIIFNTEKKIKFGLIGDYKWRFPSHVSRTYRYGSRLRYTFIDSMALSLEHLRSERNNQSEAALSYYF
ncbi:DUF4105 domain-containing protein [Halobacteriovorax sp.]|uniref:Lnb N-terminal periplasmic domain-containing protein n=1 Tax=Halobacteriovorax sp. TaxID=2020862 RepID=UPI00356AE5AB